MFTIERMMLDKRIVMWKLYWLRLYVRVCVKVFGRAYCTLHIWPRQAFKVKVTGIFRGKKSCLTDTDWFFSWGYFHGQPGKDSHESNFLPRSDSEILSVAYQVNQQFDKCVQEILRQRREEGYSYGKEASRT